MTAVTQEKAQTAMAAVRGGDKHGEHVLKTGPTRKADGLVGGCETGSRIKSDFKVFSLDKGKHDSVIDQDG